MNPLSSVRFWPGLLLVALLSGCNSINQRITENADTYGQLPPEIQQTIREGHISIGFTPVMVYMALGKPSEINTSADGTETTWTFIHFNTPEGALVLTPETPVGKMTGTQMAFNGSSDNSRRVMGPPANDNTEYKAIAGGSDLYNGRVRAPDSRIREATARDMITEDSRQDLLIKFRDGFVVGFELVRVF